MPRIRIRECGQECFNEGEMRLRKQEVCPLFSYRLEKLCKCLKDGAKYVGACFVALLKLENKESGVIKCYYGQGIFNLNSTSQM